MERLDRCRLSSYLALELFQPELRGSAAPPVDSVLPTFVNLIPKSQQNCSKTKFQIICSCHLADEGTGSINELQCLLQPRRFKIVKKQMSQKLTPVLQYDLP